MTVVAIDGSLGEGGGQVLRTSLTLAMLTGKELRIANVRAGRSSPGLRHQHLTAVKAAAAVCQADVTGAQLGSQRVVFRPGEVKPGRYRFRIPTAGSAGLVLQTIFYPLAGASASSRIEVEGGTHVPWSPCYHYLDWQWRPFLQRIGYRLSLSLEQAGYYPRGGGKLQAVIEPGMGSEPLLIEERGAIEQIRGLSAVSNLPEHIARRQRKRTVARLGADFPLNDIRVKSIPAAGKGSVMLLLIEFSSSQACYFSLGEKGKRAEIVADQAVDQVLDCIQSRGAVDTYLADQLLLPLSLTGKRSRIVLPEISEHLRTNARVIEKFLETKIHFRQTANKAWLMEVEG